MNPYIYCDSTSCVDNTFLSFLYPFSRFIYGCYHYSTITDISFNPLNIYRFLFIFTFNISILCSYTHSVWEIELRSMNVCTCVSRRKKMVKKFYRCFRTLKTIQVDSIVEWKEHIQEIERVWKEREKDRDRKT